MCIGYGEIIRIIKPIRIYLPEPVKKHQLGDHVGSFPGPHLTEPAGSPRVCRQGGRQKPRTYTFKPRKTPGQTGSGGPDQTGPGGPGFREGVCS